MPNWITSPEWDEARRSGFRALAYADVLQEGVVVDTLEVTGGSITCDEKSKVRRNLSLSLGDISLDPRTASDLLAPFGTELAVYAGMEYSGHSEYVPVGVFALDEAGRSGWTADVSLSGFDRAGLVAEARFLQPWSTLVGTRVVDEIAALILDVLPDVEVLDVTGDDSTVRAATWDRERWDAIDNLAKGIGAEVFFDQMGRAIIRPVPTVSAVLDAGDVDMIIHANRADSDLLDVATGLSRADVYNAVVASSDQEVPVTAIAYQATGPLRWRKGFQKPRFYATPVVTTYEGISKAAVSILTKSLAYSRKISPTVVADYSADAGSVVQVSLPDETTETRILSSFSITLGEGSMACTTRVDPEYDTTDDTGRLE